MQPASHSTELTLRAIVLGISLSIIMGAANVYMGLKAGMTVSASIPAAVIAMLLFKVLFRGGTVLESNQVQTAASAGESLAAGVIFTMPALVMVGYWSEFDFMTVSIVAFAGGLLGVLFMIPMRRVFILESKELPYPEGIACAAVLETNTKDTSETKANAAPLFKGTVLGALFKLLEGYFGVVSHTLQGAFLVGGRILYYGTYISPMFIAVGVIVRLNIAFLIFIGGAIAWLICMPLFGLNADPSISPVEQAWTLWSQKIRYLGVGAMMIGGINSIFETRKGLARAVVTLRQQFQSKQRNGGQDRDIPPYVVLSLSSLAIILAGFITYQFTSSIEISLVAVLLTVVSGFFFTAVACYIVGLVGNSNSPVSGMTITAVLFSGLVFYLFQISGIKGLVATLIVAAIVCCIACTAGDICNDLKTGQIVGASPFRQQIMQILGVAVASVIMAPVLQLLHHTTPSGIGGDQMPAPQAALMASLASALAGEGRLEWRMIVIGAGIGLVIVAIDSMLKRVGKGVRAYPMPIAVGMYLPFGLGTPILIGGILAYWFRKPEYTSKGKPDRLDPGLLFSSGVIAGESILGIGTACLVGLGIKPLELALLNDLVTPVTVLVFLSILWSFIKIGMRN